jgi:hypothetical protein
MKNHYILLLLATFALLSGSIATGQDDNISKSTRLGSLPDNPCELLTQAQVSAITGLEVTSVQRVRGIVAEHEIRDSDLGRICSYQTRSEFGAITIIVEARAERRTAVYWEKRAKYFETFPGAAKGVADLGMDAWVAGGNTLHVLVREDEYFALCTQMWQPRSRDLLINIARVALDKLH